MIQVNQFIQNLKPSSTLAINQKVKKLRSDGKIIYHFGFGQSPFPIHSSITTALKDHVEDNNYLPTNGLELLRHEISNFLNNHQGIECDPDSIFIGPGSKELLYQTILILEGVFLIPKGSWVSFLPQIKSKNGNYEILETKLNSQAPELFPFLPPFVGGWFTWTFFVSLTSSSSSSSSSPSFPACFFLLALSSRRK